MAVNNDLLEIEEAIDIFSELRARHEKNGQSNVVVLELTRLELSLHERARALRAKKPKIVSKKKKGRKSESISGGDRGEGGDTALSDAS